MSNVQCADLKADRDLGEYWEREFCKLAARAHKVFTPLQIGRKQSAQAYGKFKGKWHRLILPDITVWSCPGEHHEIKHKAPTRYDSFSLEKYRFDALVWFAQHTKQAVMYTIHNHALNGGREDKESKLEHWFTVNVLGLVGKQSFTGPGKSYVNGKPKIVTTYYWQSNLWMPLASFWEIGV